MESDGYFDMSIYIHSRIKKDDMYAKLSAQKSKYIALYDSPYPKKDNILSEWKKIFPKSESNINHFKLTYEEAMAIVNWVYRSFQSIDERKSFTMALLQEIKLLNGISNDIKLKNGVVYNSTKIDLHFFSSVLSISTFISRLQIAHHCRLFYRGHSNCNYTLQPSIMRTPRLKENENNLYNELLINCPSEFESCRTHLEKLVKMQHYGLPTRLLDITENLLVALFFACNGQSESYGELVLISADSQEIKYPQSDTISILASLPVFSLEKKNYFKSLATNSTLSKSQFNHNISRLIHEVCLEKPAFQPDIEKQDILDSHIVYALKSNNRIIKQDGAFILCGLNDDPGFLERFRYKNNGKKVIILINDKKAIRKQLETFSINHATLFPEIECVSEYLKEKYS